MNTTSIDRRLTISEFAEKLLAYIRNGYRLEQVPPSLTLDRDQFGTLLATHLYGTRFATEVVKEMVSQAANDKVEGPFTLRCVIRQYDTIYRMTDITYEPA